MNKIFILMAVFVANFGLVYSQSLNNKPLLKAPECDTLYVCVGKSIVLNGHCKPEGGKYDGPGVQLNVGEYSFVPQLVSGPGVYELTYTEELTGICNFKVILMDTVSPAGPISGPNEACQGQTYQYSIESVTNAEKYLWSFKGNTFETPTPELPLFIDGNFSGSGELTVKGVSSGPCGDGMPSPALIINIKTRPYPVIQSKNSTASTVCINGIYEYITTSPFASYSWSVPSTEGTILGDANMEKVKVHWDAGSSGKVIVTITNSEGCTGDTSLQVIKEGYAPSPSSIWRFGYNILVASDSADNMTYRWYNTENRDATLSTKRFCHIPDTNAAGSFVVESCFGDCCNTSEPLVFHAKSGDKASSGYRVVAQGNHLQVFPPVPEHARLTLVNAMGQAVYRGQGETARINMDALASGLYILWIEDRTHRESVKFFKTR